jgi:hypothetical protein
MRLTPEKSSLPRLLVFPFGLLGLFGLVLARFHSDLVYRLAHCTLRDITGLPCPTCGGTRAALALAQGNFSSAFGANPLVAVGLVILGVWVLVGLLATTMPRLRRTIEFTPREKRTARILAVLIIVSAWIWQIRILKG